MIKDIDSGVLIVKYEPEEEKDKIIEKNKVEVAVVAKNALINFTKVILKYL